MNHHVMQPPLQAPTGHVDSSPLCNLYKPHARHLHQDSSCLFFFHMAPRTISPNKRLVCLSRLPSATVHNSTLRCHGCPLVPRAALLEPPARHDSSLYIAISTPTCHVGQALTAPKETPVGNLRGFLQGPYKRG